MKGGIHFDKRLSTTPIAFPGFLKLTPEAPRPGYYFFPPATTMPQQYFLRRRTHSCPDRIHLAYEMAMAAVLKQFNTGVTLHKKDASGNFKPLVVNTTIPDPNKPKKKVYTQDCL